MSEKKFGGKKDIKNCKKCGNVMERRKINDNFQAILQCIVCKYWEDI